MVVANEDEAATGCGFLGQSRPKATTFPQSGKYGFDSVESTPLV